MDVNESSAAEHAIRVAAYGTKGRGFGLLLVSSMGFQVLAGLCLAVIMPILIRSLYETSRSPAMLVDESFFGTVGAFLLGYLLYRKVTGFPGVRASAYILPVFALAFGLMVAAFFILRLDYSRIQFLASFGIAVTFFYAIYILMRRLSRMELAIVPFGDISRLTPLQWVNWRVLRSPLDARGRTGIVADFRSDLPDEWEHFIAEQALAGVPVYDARHVFESLSGRVVVEHLSENPMGYLFINSVYPAGKRYLDFITALAALVVLSPLLCVCMVIIRMESKGPAIFMQDRMGLGGKPFKIFKLRTMRGEPGTDETLEGQMTTTGDARITGFGHFLRRARLDELPQIINILRGEMSWIGPRPEALKLSAWYESMIPFYRYRYIVRPGISGWAQVNQGHVTSLDDAQLKLQYDFFYVKHFSLWLDVLVALRTIRVIVTGQGAR